MVDFDRLCKPTSVHFIISSVEGKTVSGVEKINNIFTGHLSFKIRTLPV